MSFLDHHELFHSSDLNFVRDSVSRIFCPHRLDLVGPAKKLDARMRSRRLGSIAVNYVDYGGDVRIDPGELDSFFVIQMPVRGKSRIRSGRGEIESVPGLASVPNPAEPLMMRWSADCAQLIVRIERSALEAHLHDLVGYSSNGRLTFELGMDLTRGYGRAWWRSVLFLARELDQTDTFVDHRLIAPAIEAYLMAGLFRAQPCNVDLSRTGPESAAPHRAVATARDLIEAHPDWDLTVPRLAREAGVTVRTLQKWFRRDLGCTPVEYLRDVRLQRVHDTLRAARPGEVTVHEVASRWGFLHHSHFAAAYRRRFAQSPKSTLDT